MSEAYDLGSYEEFDSKMNNADSRRKLYDFIDKDGQFDIGDFDYFDKAMQPQQKEEFPASEIEQPNVTASKSVETKEPAVVDAGLTDAAQAGATVITQAMNAPVPGSIAAENEEFEKEMRRLRDKAEWKNKVVAQPGENPYNGKTYGQVMDEVAAEYGKNLSHPDVDPYAEARAQIMQAGIADDLNPDEADRLALRIRDRYANDYAKTAAQGVVSSLPDQVPNIDQLMDGAWYTREMQQSLANNAARLGLRQEVYVNQYVKPMIAKTLSDRYGYDENSANHIAGRLLSQEAHTMERVRQNEAEAMTGKYIAPYIQEYFDNAAKAADERFKAETNGAADFTPTGLPNGQTLVAGLRRYQATDPDKIWEEMKPNVDQMAQAITSSPEFFVEAMQHADEEGVDATKWIENRIMPVILPQIQQQFEQMAIEREMPKNTMEYLWANFEQSLVGSIARAALESQARSRMKAEALQRTEAGQGAYNPSFGARIGGGFISMAPDMMLPFGGPFGIVSKVATKPIRGMAQTLITDGMRPILARMAESSASGMASLGAFEAVK